MGTFIHEKNINHFARSLSANKSKGKNCLIGPMFLLHICESNTRLLGVPMQSQKMQLKLAKQFPVTVTQVRSVNTIKRSTSKVVVGTTTGNPNLISMYQVHINAQHLAGSYPVSYIRCTHSRVLR